MCENSKCDKTKNLLVRLLVGWSEDLPKTELPTYICDGSDISDSSDSSDCSDSSDSSDRSYSSDQTIFFSTKKIFSLKIFF